MSLAFTLASRNLFQDRLRFVASLVGIVLSVVLVMVQMGLYFGFGRMVTTMIDHASTDLWIVASGAKCFEDLSLLNMALRNRLRAIDGTAEVIPVVIGFSAWMLPDGAILRCSSLAPISLPADFGCMLAPTEGTVRVCGACTSGARPQELAQIRRQHVGFVFQSYHLFTTLTVAENVRLALDVRGERGLKAMTKTEEVLASVGLTAKMASFPRQLSGGEQQRVAIARAIVADPSAILADEPTAALDNANGQAIMTILSAIAKQRGRAVLVVTHDPRLFGFADRILHIEDGSITQEEPADFRDQSNAPPRNGARQMSLLEGPDAAPTGPLFDDVAAL